jgi:aspartate aminotransferase-like enzyme
MTPGKFQRSEAWRIGLMGATSTSENVKKVLGALRVCLGK